MGATTFTGFPHGTYTGLKHEGGRLTQPMCVMVIPMSLIAKFCCLAGVESGYEVVTDKREGFDVSIQGKMQAEEMAGEPE